MDKDKKIRELEQAIKDLQQQNRWLMEQLKVAKHQRFGASSEQNSNQLSFFNEVETEIGGKPEPKLEEIKSYHRRKSGGIGIDRLPKDLPVEIVEHKLPGEEQFCPRCSGNLHAMGVEIREELKFMPAKAVIVRHVSHTYACRNCEKNGINVPILKAKMPNSVIKGSFAAPETIAHIAYEKFMMGSPLYRQEADWERKGIKLSR